MKILWAVLLAPTLASADAPVKVDAPVNAETVQPGEDAHAKRAGDESNLETLDRRRGFWMHAALGPSVTVGGNNTGTGAGGTLLFGTVVRPSAVVFVGITANGVRHEVMDEVYINDYTTLMGGFTWWPSSAGSGYFRGAAGFGAYRCKQCRNPDDPQDPVTIDFRRRGIALSGTVGIDLVRFKGIVWGLDLGPIFTITPEGVITSLNFQSYLSLD